MIKIISWNINSINARLESLQKLILDENPDIILLQEIKCLSENFPYDFFESSPYNMYINGQKSYNGVAILSKLQLEDIKLSFPNNPISAEARFIEASGNINGIYTKIISVYIPNGSEVGSEKFQIKILFLNEFFTYIKSLIINDQELIIGGDFNIALTTLDSYTLNHEDDNILTHYQVREQLHLLLNYNIFDVYRTFEQKTPGFTWWDYRAGSYKLNKGFRIDYFLATMNNLQNVQKIYVNHEIREQSKASDHAPLVMIL